MEKTPDKRIGDSERSAALDRLTELFTNGYLDVHEFDARTAVVVRSTHASDLVPVFADMPAEVLSDRAVPGDSESKHPERSAVSSDAEAELDRIIQQGKRVQRADAVIWTATMALFFLGLFVFNWSAFWVVLPIAGLLSAGVRWVYGLDDDAEEIFDELNEAEKERRAERLKVAMERRKELGQ
ncbi:DUF1707 domain-containing protein [Corynebacterium sp.]|uniref:DUF1707 SHOCT-like domain-containing protein n=1 Tax=Corynebacterium sp. TaxID=1720 RepID=UPI002A90BC51|nr:DUF1707 domain-containing protein [Corynebacterium sp.]MDY5785160.1 DUF1707 domain-containing protein [Corynebacterium sp.]